MAFFELLHDIYFSSEAVESELGLLESVLENLIVSLDAEVGCAVVRDFLHSLSLIINSIIPELIRLDHMHSSTTRVLLRRMR